MKKKSIFQASFEESLKLKNDSMINLQKKAHNKTEKFFVSGRPSLWFKIRSFLLTLIFPIGLNCLWVLLSKQFQSSSFKKLSFSPPHHNLLNFPIYFALLTVWLFLVVLGKKFFRQASVLPYRYQFHCYSFMIMLVLVLDLLAIDIFLSNLPLYIILAVILMLIALFYLMYHSKITSLQMLLYHQNYKVKLLDKIAKFIGIYGLGILAIITILNKLLLSILGKPSASLENLGMSLVVLVANLMISAITIFIGIPYFLQAYYKWKYPEEYREWEGRSLEEWYGKKYLKKHPELLKKELQ
ncbi:hypothetical protein [Streptococcus macacae]|uniref:Membrane protein n=1 Tax=Streptococcus macacae NCTC 11558 TaxID=764298 RepID=G5JX92_9STRE|nr:hypothetical protein [Streptococcus macacae]EHJ53390.1 putative membrane protein [Streptococcus macacae NCTC 11558]SUN77865.1 Uncharacterised protein [Streptococcus macacae NCTC 11558]